MNERILIGDSSPQVCNVLQTLLLKAGYTALFAADGIRLVEQARKHQPDLILLDFCLPAGNTSVLVQTVRRFPSFAHTPIFVTAERQYRMAASTVFDWGANAFLPKPFNRQVLLSLIARFLPSKSTAASPPVPGTAIRAGQFESLWQNT